VDLNQTLSSHRNGPVSWRVDEVIVFFEPPMGTAYLGRLCGLKTRRGCSALMLLLLLGGCAAPLGTQKLTLTESYRQLNRSALSGATLSDSTLITLRRRNLMTTWKTNPEAAVTALRTQVVGQPDSWPDLFALAELSYFLGRQSYGRTWVTTD
jgi:hypothetical protein